MIVSDGRCEQYEPAEYGVERGRLRILAELGPFALLYDKNPSKKKTGDKLMASRPNLRALALAANIVQKSPKIFQYSAEKLNDLLADHYEGIEEMDDDEVLALIEDAKESSDDAEEAPAKKAPAKKAPAKKASRRRKPAAKEEPEEEEPPAKKAPARRRKPAAKKEEEEEAEEAPAKKAPTRRRRKPAAKKEEEAPAEEAKAAPARKRRSRAAKKEEAVEASSGADLTELMDKVDTIGGIADGLVKSVKGLATSLEVAALVAKLDALNEKLDAVDAGLTVLYNEDVEDGDEIASCAELLEGE